jgi:hypothetical protein
MATRYWEGAGTDPNDLKDATNWSGNTLPADGDTAIIATSPSDETDPFVVSATGTAILFPASGAFAAFRVGPGINRNFASKTAASATTTITITDYTELNNGDKVNLIATDGNNYDFTCGDPQDSATGTWEATTSNNATATNLMNVINSSSGPSGTRFTATVDTAALPNPIVTVTQATAGQAGNTAVTLTDSGTAGMEADAAFTGGTETTCTINTAILDLSGRGAYQGFKGTNTTTTVHDCTIGDDAVHLGGTMTNLRVLGGNGRINVSDSSTATTIDFLDASLANMVIGASVTNTTITMNTSSVTTSSNATTVNALGGSFTMDGSATCTTLNNHHDAMTSYNTSGTLTTLNVYGGTFDMSQSGASSVTLTNVTLYEGGVIDERNGLANVVYTNGIITKGGTVFTDAARTMTVTA